MNINGTPFLSFLSYTQRFVCSHDCTLHGIGFWKIYVILTAQSSTFATNVRKTPRKCRSWAACHPGASEKMHVQFFRHQFAPGWEFHPGQDRRGTFIPRRIFSSFLVVNSVRRLTIHRVEFNPGRNFSCKQALSKNLVNSMSTI